MSGVAVVRYLLAHYGSLTAVAPAARIVAGELPINTPMPAISIKQISSVRRNTVGMNETKTLVTERVQATVLMPATKDYEYPALQSAMTLVRKACPNQRGTVAGVSVDSILPDIEGPDLEGPTPESIARSQDFFVRWHETR